MLLASNKSTSDDIELKLSVGRDPRSDASATMRDLRSSDGKWGARSGLSIKSPLDRFQIVLAVIAGSIALFYTWSRLNGGLIVEGGCLQFVLVHVHTSALFLVACFWGHVESAIRCLTSGLDGVSSMNGSWQARRRRVALAVGCSVLVKLLVIISTGLVATTPEDRLVVRGIPTLIMGLTMGLLMKMIGWLQSGDVEGYSTFGTISDQSCLNPEGYHSNDAPIEKPRPHDCERSNASQLSKAHFTKGEPTWEVPKPRLWPLLMLFVTSVVLVTLLEYSYQCSRNHNGFKDVDVYDGYIAIIWRFIPPLLVLGVSTCYDIWAFRSRSRQQHSHLDWDPEALNVHREDPSAPLPHSGYIRAAATIISIITGNLILAVASGLFITQNADSGIIISVIQTDTFDFSETNLSNIGLDAAPVNLNSSNILWTYGAMTFPSFSLPGDTNTEENHLITVTLPASRAKSNCAAVSPENIEFSHLSNNDGAYINITNPSSCASTPLALEVPYGYFGLAQTNGDGLCNTMHPERGRWLVSTGYIDAEDASNSETTVLLCNPSAETVQTEATFHTPSLQIDHSNPPIVHESTATHATFFLDHPEADSEEQEDMHGIVKPGRRVSPEYYANELFQVMVSETPPVNYVGEENMHRLLAAVQTGFGIRQAQHTNYHFRKTLPGEKRPALNGTMWNPSRLRIVQDAGSTYILQGLIAWVFICAIANTFAKRLDQKTERTSGGEGAKKLLEEVD